MLFVACKQTVTATLKPIKYILEMKIIITAFVFILTTIVTKAQTDTAIAISGYPIEMLFPQGKTKALILSYDDGRTEDRQLVKLMNQYGLIGTFHLNSNKLGTAGYVTKEEIKQLYKGHEVSVHSANHPNLTTLSKIDIVYEVVEDRKALERLMGYPIRGMAYPFGNNNEIVIDAIKGLGIEYARTVDDTYNFKIPELFLKWHPTMHQFAKAYWEPNNPENDKKELAHFYQIINDFIGTKELAILDVWGHSWEMGNSKSKWDETEKFFQLLANNPAIHYSTQIDLVDYINAFHNLSFSVEKDMVYNQSSLTIYFKLNNIIYSVLPGKTLVLSR
jgi:peptidoglycan/xylan/chitin deacetylase (PgdA/CDA1 family)